jgi:hypothetical protein
LKNQLAQIKKKERTTPLFQVPTGKKRGGKKGSIDSLQGKKQGQNCSGAHSSQQLWSAFVQKKKTNLREGKELGSIGPSSLHFLVPPLYPI